MSAYAIFRTGGKQFKVAVGDKLRVEKLLGDVGTKLTFDDVLLVGSGDGKFKIGQPVVAGAKVEAKITAHAPSLIPDALPAVTVPVGLTIGFSFASPSAVVSARGCSSASTTRVSPFFPLATCTGTISPLKNPAAFARAHRCWLRNANAS